MYISAHAENPTTTASLGLVYSRLTREMEMAEGWSEGLEACLLGNRECCCSALTSLFHALKSVLYADAACKPLMSCTGALAAGWVGLVSGCVLFVRDWSD